MVSGMNELVVEPQNRKPFRVTDCIKCQEKRDKFTNILIYFTFEFNKL